MASEITHVVYGKKIFNRLDNLLWPEYVVGTLFPDIRYKAKIDRELLHFKNTLEEKIPSNGSFKAGIYVHSLIDEKRDKFLKEREVYKLLPKSILSATALKAIEDKLVFSRFSNWDEVISILEKPLDDEYEFGVSKGVVRGWHKFLQKYFSEGPSKKTWKMLIGELGFDEKLVEDFFIQIDLIEKNKEVIKIIKNTYDYI